MAKSLNRAQLLGNLGKDPELKVTPQGRNVCTFSIATTDSYKDKNDVWQEITDWHNVVFWDRLAETAGKYLHKGSKVLIEGRIKTRSYEKDGSTRYITEIVGQTMIMLDSKQSDGSSYSRSEGFPEPPASSTDDDDEVPF